MSRVCRASVLGPNVAGTFNVYLSTDGDLRLHASLSVEEMRVLADTLNAHLDGEDAVVER